MAFEVRTAGTEDRPLLVTMSSQLWEDEGGERMPRTFFERRMQTLLSDGYAAEIFTEAGQPVGYVLWRDDGDRLYLRQVFVSRDHRRQGIGRAMFNTLLGGCLPQRDMIKIDVIDGNEIALAFWQELGFMRMGAAMALPLRSLGET